MEIHIERDDFISILNNASRFVSHKSKNSINIQGILCVFKDEKLTVTSTNLSQYFISSTAIKTVKNECSFIIDHQKILEFFTLLDSGEVIIVYQSNKIEIKQKDVFATFPISQNTEFPQLPIIKEDESVKLSKEFFTQSLALLTPIVAKDSVRPALSGILIEKRDEEVLLVATDGFRMSLVTIKDDAYVNGKNILPGVFIEEVIRYLKNTNNVEKIECVFIKKEAIFAAIVNETTLFTRIIDAQFPDFKGVIPTSKNTSITIAKSDLLRMIKTMSVFARDYGNIIVLEIKDSSLRIRPKKEAGNSMTELQIIKEGEDISVGFNYKHILDYISSTTDEEIHIDFLRQDSPVVFKTKNSNLTHIIMPMKVVE
jgi:DNA polymerase III subunit beta